MNRVFTIGGKVVSDDSASFIIAEIGHNHQGDLEKCKAMFKAAKEAGADSVKLQKRDNRALFTGEMYNAPYNSENAYAPTYGEHREVLEFNREQYLALIDCARELDILFFATAFDAPSADFLASLDMPAYKIASGDLGNTSLLKQTASFGKPVIISTGGATLADVRRAYETIVPINRNLCIMQCTSCYPPAHEELNLRVIETFRREFPDIVIGFSSHDSGIAMPLIGYMLGARLFEKHFTLNRSWKGADQSFSLEPGGLRRVVRDLERARVALGDGEKQPYESEAAPLAKMVKRIVAARDLKAGAILTEMDLAFRIVAGNKTGPAALQPFHADKLIGRKLETDLIKDDLVTYAAVGICAGTN